MVITEALAEIKLIEKKIESKEQFVRENLFYPKHLTNALPNGIESEVQAIADLRERWVALRSGIAAANQETQVEIRNMTRSVQGWLTWKREIASKMLAFHKSIFQNLKAAQDRQINNPSAYKDDEGKTHIVDIAYRLDYQKSVKAAEMIQEILDTLDGKLSLINATAHLKV